MNATADRPTTAPAAPRPTWTRDATDGQLATAWTVAEGALANAKGAERFRLRAVLRDIRTEQQYRAAN